jgi:hypothetical protein
MTSLLTIQHGIFTRAQAAAAGVPAPHGVPSAAKVLPNIYSVIPPPLTWEARMWVGALHGGDDAALVGRSGAAVYGWMDRDPSIVVQVLVPHDRQRSSSGFVVVKRTRVPLWTSVGGLPVAEPARTLVTLGAQLSLRELTAVAAKAVQRREVRLTDVIDLAQSHRRMPGAGAALKVATRLIGGEESLPEHDLVRLVMRAGLSEPLRQVDIFDGNELVTTADCLWVDPLVAGYYDGRVHLSADSQDGDAIKTLRIKGLGIEPVRVTAAGMRRPRIVTEAFIAAHRAAAAAGLPASPRLRLRHRGVWLPAAGGFLHTVVKESTQRQATSPVMGPSASGK